MRLVRQYALTGLHSDLWSALTEEVRTHLRDSQNLDLTIYQINDPGDLFSDVSDEESEIPVFSTTNPMDENALLLGTFSNQQLNALHPQKELLLKLWETFCENVNCLIKLIHVPSFQKTIDEFCASPYQVSKTIEALLFAIYLAAVASLEEDECVTITGEPRNTILSRYRMAAQQALVNATFLKSTSIVTLQAYYIFLVSCV